MDSTTWRCSIFINRFWELNCDYMPQILHIVNNSQHSDMISCQSSHTEVWKMYHVTSFTCSLSLSLPVYFFFLGDISPALCSLLSHCSRRPVGRSITAILECSKYRASLSFWARRPKANYKNQHSLCMRENSQCNSRCRTEELTKLSLPFSFCPLPRSLSLSGSLSPPMTDVIQKEEPHKHRAVGNTTGSHHTSGGNRTTEVKGKSGTIEV